jgi:outer membrane receptor protein involved in Fe transport
VYDQQEFTWKVNATYNLSDATMMYATVSSSFKSGGFNPISDNSPLLDPSFGGRPENAYFEPEFIDAFELGIKTTLLDGSMQINAAGFFYDYQDLQQSKIVNVTSLNQNSDAEITGLELDVLWALTPNLILSLSGGYLDTELKSFLTVDTANPNASSEAAIAASNGLAATEGVVSVNGVNFLPGADATGQRGRCETLAPNPCYGFLQDLSGNQLAGSPELNFNIGLAWTIPVGSMDLTLATNYYWQDEYYTSNFNTRNSLVEDWSMWNASARLSGESWYAEAWIKNIEDQDNVTGSYLTSTVSSLFTNQFILDPQTYGISLGLRF